MFRRSVLVCACLIGIITLLLTGCSYTNKRSTPVSNEAASFFTTPTPLPQTQASQYCSEMNQSADVFASETDQAAIAAHEVQSLQTPDVAISIAVATASPDKSHIAYTNAAGAVTIYTPGAPADGSFHAISHPPAGFSDWSPIWVTDGLHIIFARGQSRTRAGSALYIVSMAGPPGNERQLTYPAANQRDTLYQPVVPFGDSIVFIRETFNSDGGTGTVWGEEVFVVSLRTGETHQLVLDNQGTHQIDSIAVSPNDKQVVVEAQVGLEYSEVNPNRTPDLSSPALYLFTLPDSYSDRPIKAQVPPGYPGWLLWTKDNQYISYTATDPVRKLLIDVGGNPAGIC